VKLEDFWYGFLTAVLVFTLIALPTFGCVVDSGWQRLAVKHGAAEYDQQTGEWRWKVKVEDEY
jgi:hypothetical protein